MRRSCFCLHRQHRRKACLCEVEDTVDAIFLTIEGSNIGYVDTNDRVVTFGASTALEDLLTGSREVKLPLPSGVLLVL